MFSKFIALFFLVIFIIKLFNPNFFPYINKGINAILAFFRYTLKLLIESSLYTFYLLFTKTVYVIGLDIIFAILINIVIIIYVSPGFDINLWFILLKNNLFSSYVFSFFTFTYLIGFYQYLKVKTDIKPNLFKIFNVRYKSNNSKQGHYTYNEDTNDYTYHD